MLITMIVICVVIAIAIGLQIYLSKKQNKWLGLILPMIIFVCSAVAVLKLAVEGDVNLPRRFFGATSTLLEFNIPSIALLIIYKIYHKK